MARVLEKIVKIKFYYGTCLIYNIRIWVHLNSFDEANGHPMRAAAMSMLDSLWKERISISEEKIAEMLATIPGANAVEVVFGDGESSDGVLIYPEWP